MFGKMTMNHLNPPEGSWKWMPRPERKRPMMITEMRGPRGPRASCQAEASYGSEFIYPIHNAETTHHLNIQTY